MEEERGKEGEGGRRRGNAGDWLKERSGEGSRERQQFRNQNRFGQRFEAGKKRSEN